MGHYVSEPRWPVISVGTPDFVSVKTGRVIDSDPEVVLEALVPSDIS